MMADLRDRASSLPGDEWPVVSCELNQSAEENQRMQSRN